MSILLGPDCFRRTDQKNASALAAATDSVLSPSEKRRMSNPALGDQPGVIEVEVGEVKVQELSARAEMEGASDRQDALQMDFVKLCDSACSVICCRMSPSQKGRMVLLMRRLHPDLCALAIGDGANDVNMIQSANIGVGVRGKEGMQAVLASDYAITRFRFLLPLLLVHGRWNYRRQSKTILYLFYKSMCYACTQFWYNLLCAWTMQPMYDLYAQMLFSVVFSAVPIIVFGITERDLEAETLLTRPGLYAQGNNPRVSQPIFC
jgi:magnesium-transporting ATPase (P-type)